jgi:hypothetical protein
MERNPKILGLANSSYIFICKLWQSVVSLASSQTLPFCRNKGNAMRARKARIENNYGGNLRNHFQILHETFQEFQQKEKCSTRRPCHALES